MCTWGRVHVYMFGVRVHASLLLLQMFSHVLGVWVTCLGSVYMLTYYYFICLGSVYMLTYYYFTSVYMLAYYYFTCLWSVGLLLLPCVHVWGPCATSLIIVIITSLHMFGVRVHACTC